MSQLPPRDIKYVVSGIPARNKILEGARQMYEGVSAVYGPAANNAILIMPFGDPVLTRDGVTVAKRISSANAGLKDRDEDAGARILYQASEKTNKTAGDGTTATIVLGYHLLNAGHQRIVAGENAMVIKKQLDKDSQAVIEWVKSKSIEASNKQLQEVATVSAGDPLVGRLVADTMQDIGLEGGITVKEQKYPTLDVEKINGYYFEKGFEPLEQSVEFKRPKIFVSSKRMSVNGDVLDLIRTVASSDNPKLILIGEVSGEAFNTLLANTMAQADSNGRPFPFECLIIQPPAFGTEGLPFFEDIATYVGTKVFQESHRTEDIDDSFFGTADLVKVSKQNALMLGASGDADTISSRAAAIKAQLDKETNAHIKDRLEQRYSKLVGKIAIVNVGAATDAEMEELRFRVEDAIEAVKSSMIDGIVPGGATTLARASQLEISTLFRDALQSTFKKLFDNAAEESGYRLGQILNTEFGKGFNLRDISKEPIDLGKAGIWDATRSVCQIVENATSAAGSLLTAGTVVGMEESYANDND